MTGPPADPCDNPPLVTIEISADQAILNDNMHLGDIGGEVGDYAYSEAELSGRASFGFLVDCQDEYRAWAYVHDPVTGPFALGFWGDPDSFRVSFDADVGTRASWLYGCELNAIGKGGATWAWLPATDNEWCDGPPFITWVLDPGPHAFHMTNREAGTHMVSGSEIGEVAAVARVIITNDPGFTPP